MALNRASRKEADSRLGLLKKQVSLQVFTLRFEDSACREARAVAEELAEATSRLSVEISDASVAGDLLRKFRIDAAPALVVSAKDAPDLRLYGVPTANALPALLDALVHAGSPIDPRSPLSAAARAAAGSAARSAVHLDLVVSRRSHFCAESAGALWRAAAANHAAGDPLRIVAAVRIVEDFPLFSAAAPPGAFAASSPFLLVDGKSTLEWPFTDADILSRLA